LAKRADVKWTQEETLRDARPGRRASMRTASVIILVVLLAAGPALGRPNPAAIVAEAGGSAIALGVYSCFVAGVFSDAQELSAAAQHIPLAEASLPRATVLIAAGTALAASPLVAAAAVNAVGGLFGETRGSAYALSVAAAYIGAAFVFDYEWKAAPSPSVAWLPDWLPEWVVRLTLATSLAATVGFNLGIAIQ
jgi:hypothetical protein